jgi:hypothetical protein
MLWSTLFCNNLNSGDLDLAGVLPVREGEALLNAEVGAFVRGGS